MAGGRTHYATRVHVTQSGTPLFPLQNPEEVINESEIPPGYIGFALSSDNPLNTGGYVTVFGRTPAGALFSGTFGDVSGFGVGW